jgi:hypothetical protein
MANSGPTTNGAGTLNRPTTTIAAYHASRARVAVASRARPHNSNITTVASASTMYAFSWVP